MNWIDFTFCPRVLFALMFVIGRLSCPCSLIGGSCFKGILVTLIGLVTRWFCSRYVFQPDQFTGLSSHEEDDGLQAAREWLQLPVWFHLPETRALHIPAKSPGGAGAVLHGWCVSELGEERGNRQGLQWSHNFTRRVPVSNDYCILHLACNYQWRMSDLKKKDCCLIWVELAPSPIISSLKWRTYV